VRLVSGSVTAAAADSPAGPLAAPAPPPPPLLPAPPPALALPAAPNTPAPAPPAAVPPAAVPASEVSGAAMAPILECRATTPSASRQGRPCAWPCCRAGSQAVGDGSGSSCAGEGGRPAARETGRDKPPLRASAPLPPLSSSLAPPPPPPRSSSGIGSGMPAAAAAAAASSALAAPSVPPPPHSPVAAREGGGGGSCCCAAAAASPSCRLIIPAVAATLRRKGEAEEVAPAPLWPAMRLPASGPDCVVDCVDNGAA